MVNDKLLEEIAAKIEKIEIEHNKFHKRVTYILLGIWIPIIIAFIIMLLYVFGIS